MGVVGRDERIQLLERDAEHAAVAAVVAAARDGAGGLVVIEGPAGIGKTRLLDEAAAGVGPMLGRARGGSLERDLSFGAVRELLEPLAASATDPDALFAGGAASARSVVGAGAAGPPSGMAPGEVLPGLYWLTVALAELARPEPLVLVCDDVHWFDPPSQRYLAYVAHRVAELPVAVIVGTRPPEPGPSGELLQRLIEYQGVQRIRLPPLSRAAVGQLVRETFDEAAPSGFCNAVADASLGNPFLVGEIVRAARHHPDRAHSGPFRVEGTGVETSVLARLGRLDDRAAEVAKAVAVLGHDAHLRHVATLAGCTVDEAGLMADGLLRAEILGPERPLAFVHPLVAGAVYGSLLPGERSARHRRAAAMLAAEDAPPERVAPHVMAAEPAGDPVAAATLSAAAAVAMAQGATDVAIAQLRRALAEPAPTEHRLDLVLRLGIAESLVNDAAAIDHLGEAIERIPPLSTRLVLAMARAAACTMAGRSDEAIRSLSAFDDEIGDDPALRLRQVAAIGIACTIGRVPADVAAGAFGALRSALPLDGDAPPEVLAMRAYAGAAAGEPAAEVAALAHRVLESMDERDPLLPLWFNLVVATLTMVDRDTAAADAIERGLTTARRAGAPAQVSIMLFQRGVIGFRAGDLEDAEADARASLDLCAEFDLTSFVAAPLSVLVDTLRERDDLAGAEAALVRHGFLAGEDGIGPDGVGMFDLLLLNARARLRGAQGRWDEAFVDLDLGWSLAQRAGWTSPGFVAWQANRAFGMALAGLAHDAPPIARQSLASAEAFGAPRAIAEAHRAMVIVGATDEESSGRLLAAATATFAELGARLEEARASGVLAYAVGVAGTDGELDALARATWLAEQCGAPRLAALFRARVKVLGGTRGRYRPVSGVAALTASERRVASLAATGRTNKEVAQELFVTVKTVETHLARAFQKLAISSRGELRQAMAI